MPNPDSQRRYIPVNCAQCDAPNNYSQTRTCPQCGAYLKPPAPRQNLPQRSKTSAIFGFILKSLLTIVLIAVLGIAGFIFYGTSLKQKGTANLPANSWHQPTFWNGYREKPTVREILEKNNQVTSRTIKPSDIETLSLSGTLSFAFDECTTQDCRTKEALQRARAGESYKPPTETNSPKASNEEDYFADLRFEKIGTIEVVQKGSGKVFRKLNIHPRNFPETTEITEIFNGAKGWKEEVVFNSNKILRSSLKELTGVDLEALKKSATRFGDQLSDRPVSFSHVGKVNGKVQFVLKNDDPVKPESLYLDAVTGYLTKIETNEVTFILFPYADYKGVNLPMTMYMRTLNTDGKIMWMKIEEMDWRINESVDDSIFEKKSESQS